ncbi:Full=Glyco-Gag ame: Full=Gross cell surface antigen ame: Full=glycosylated Pr80 gag Short=gPr80 Gag [Podarcis lilfordi]|uniref:Glycosylated Pr80 gag Short=gPr80 Gag n=1 Tax=Podarcis lilfordi TaxID=74358 RepID=A0AA35L284_9SAUR|nr:Full=Glyco-Gag ame: Full=Gross cell surface antigen ame: Full=glycosylated Pr80 gag Short=gPr80 Gag [Podarcis lilfordi]
MGSGSSKCTPLECFLNNWKLATKDDEGDEETLLKMLEEKVQKGEKWSKKQDKWIKDYVDPYKDQVDVSPHLLEVARCEDGRWKKKQKRWLEAARRAATHHERERGKKDQATALMPLRVVYDPPGPPGENGAAAPRTYTIQHVPFSTADICNWRNQNPSFEENPAKIIKLFEGIFKTYDPTYDDVQYLLDSLLTTEEVRRVHSEARAHLRQLQLNDNQMNDAYPRATPNWDYQDQNARTALATYRNLPGEEGAAAWDATSAPSAAKRATGRTNALREEPEAGEAGFLAPSPWEMALT